MEPSEKRKKGGNNSLSALSKKLLDSSLFKALLISFLLFILIRTFVLDFFVVNNSDMEGSYHHGDVVLVSKIFSAPQRDEVFLIRYPEIDSTQNSVLFIQRLVAIPGDSVQLADKTLVVNSLTHEEFPEEKHNYFVKSRSVKLDSAFFAKYGLNEGGSVSERFDYSFTLSREQKEALEKDSLIESVRVKSEQKNMFDMTCFPGSTHCSWNADHYGKIYIPGKNDVIALDTTIISIYEDLISLYENNSLEIKQDSILINGELSKEYRVKQNYYFFLGDNRDNARDSRHWGFLPESYLEGKLLYRITSSR